MVIGSAKRARKHILARKGEQPMTRQREIELFTCCGSRTVAVTIDVEGLSGEAWRLARCLLTTNHRRRDNGVLVESLRTNLEHAQAEGWTEQRVYDTVAVYGAEWAEDRPVIDWRFQPLHLWPNHKDG